MACDSVSVAGGGGVTETHLCICHWKIDREQGLNGNHEAESLRLLNARMRKPSTQAEAGKQGMVHWLYMQLDCLITCI